jgi:neurotransmitter:Na+ symporter, NSS family
MHKRKITDYWNSRLGVILAVSGSAVGLGNFLRFPGQVAEYGGGAFMVAYFISFLLLGLPVCWAEWALGRQGGNLGFHSGPSIFAAVTGRPRYRYLGVVAVVIPTVIYMYYVVIEAWCLAYAVNYLFGDMRFASETAASTFFYSLIGVSENGSALRFGIESIGFYVVLVFVLNFFLIYRGLSRGIELVCKIGMPTLVILAFIILIRVLTLGTPNPEHPERSINNGLGFMWNPTKTVLQQRPSEEAPWQSVPVDQWFKSDGDERLQLLQARADADPNMRVATISIWNQLARPQLWLAAASQIFFSLSVGFGVIIIYASYLKKNDDIVLSGLTASSANGFCEVALGGLISIPAAVAFFGVAGLAGIGLGTFDIGFNVLPLVFSQMPAGMLFGALFFFLLFLAALTSSLSMLQPGVAFFEESFSVGKRQAVAMLGLITAGGTGFILYFSEGLKALDTIDYWVNNLLMVSLATITIIIFGWIIGSRDGVQMANQGAVIRLPRGLSFVIRFITPLFLLCVLGTWVLEDIVGIRISSPELTGENPYVRDLFIEPNLVAWMSVTMIAMVICFVILNLLPASRFYRRMDESEHSPRKVKS